MISTVLFKTQMILTPFIIIIHKELDEMKML